ncbi:MAG: ATP synthase F1 subunit delta [Thermoguttaceae bacterium]
MPEDRTEQDARTAADLCPEVGPQQIAAVYAEALLAAAQAAGQTEPLLQEFDDLVTQVLDPFPQFEQILASALISHEEKAGILDRVLGGRTSPLMLNFLKVLSRRGRLDCLRAIRRRSRELYETMQGRVRVYVTTAAPIEAPLAERIVRQLRRLVRGEPVLVQRVDPNLIGGIVVRVGDTVYDGSVATQLKTVRQKIIDRSAHEIQSRRDRFRYPA